MSAKNKWQADLARFSVEYGPLSLFERVSYKMEDVKSVKTNGTHFQKRISERNIPKEVLAAVSNFNIRDWSLVTAEVRKDRGKFYNSTWEYLFQNKRYWLTIGLGNSAETIVEKNSSGIEKCIRSGKLYDFVEQVNRKLMDKDKMQEEI